MGDPRAQQSFLPSEESKGMGGNRSHESAVFCAMKFRINSRSCIRAPHTQQRVGRVHRHVRPLKAEASQTVKLPAPSLRSAIDSGLKRFHRIMLQVAASMTSTPRPVACAMQFLSTKKRSTPPRIRQHASCTNSWIALKEYDCASTWAASAS